MKTPMVSVIMPVYNCEKYLRESIESILTQTFKDFEFIIINDASTDGSANIIGSYHDTRIIFVTNSEHLGVTKTLNKGIDLARGKYIARMDADDISLSKRLEKQVRYLFTHRSCSVIASKVKTIDHQGVIGDIWVTDKISGNSFRKIKHHMPRQNCIAHPSIMIRAEILKRYKYDNRLYWCQDYELWLRLCADNYVIEKLNSVLIYYRQKKRRLDRNILQKLENRSVIAKLLFLFKRFSLGKIGIFELQTLRCLFY